MTTLLFKIDETSKKGKAFLEFAQLFLNEGNDVQIITESNLLVAETRSSYNPDFVKKILEVVKHEKSTEVDPNDIWGSIGLK